MSFLKDPFVDFAYTGITKYANCGGLLQETGEYYEKDQDTSSPTYGQWILKQALYHDKLTLTDGYSGIAPGQPQVIYLDDCTTTEITFPCNEPVGLVQDGKSVDIVNVCSLPLTLTGFENSDPVRFTIFDFDKYKGLEVYDTGNCDELPYTIAPYTKLNIPVFFHPSRNEIEDGREGSWDYRTGDAWGAKISINPGFPIVGCDEGGDCDSFFNLSGELVCNKLNREPLLNYGNYEGYYSCGDLNPLGDLNFENCIITSGIFADTTENTYDTYFAFQGVAEKVATKYCKDDQSFFAAANTFKDMLFTQDNLVDLLAQPHTSVFDWNGYAITGSYNGANQIIYFDGIEFTGLDISLATENPNDFAQNMTVFINVTQVGNDSSEKNILISEQGNFAQEKFCYSTKFVELDVARYVPVEDMAFSCNSLPENQPPGTVIGQLGSTEDELAAYARSDQCPPLPVQPTNEVVSISNNVKASDIDLSKQPGNQQFAYNFGSAGDTNNKGTFQENGSMGWGSLGDGDGGIWVKDGNDLLLWHPFLFGGNPLLCGCNTSVTSPYNFKNHPLISNYSNGAKGCLNICYGYFDPIIIAQKDYPAAVNHTKLYPINLNKRWNGCGGGLERFDCWFKEMSPGTVPYLYRALGLM
jgi:hypothetical protein